MPDTEPDHTHTCTPFHPQNNSHSTAAKLMGYYKTEVWRSEVTCLRSKLVKAGALDRGPICRDVQTVFILHQQCVIYNYTHVPLY